ncbi:MAG: hypothetical protein ACI392_03155 [Paludibacteraceae bacterium]
MAKVHIALVGGQPTPIYHGIVATQPDKIVFIYSKSTRQVVEKVRSEINIPTDYQEPLEPTDPYEIVKRAKELASAYKDDEVTLNISSGLKSWSHLFGHIFENQPNAAIVYMDQNNVLWNYRTMQSSTNFEFDMDVLFRLQGNALIHYVPYSEYTEADKKTMDILIQARRYNCGNFNKLTTLLSKEWEHKLNQPSGCLSLSDVNYVEWGKPDFVRLVLSTQKYGTQEFLLNSPHATSLAFHTHWFEYKIARMISHWRYAKDIRLNCKFLPQKTKSIQFPKNEVDIIVNTGTKILFVECKTVINNSTDIDKFRTAVKNYGGMGSKALFVTDNVMNDVQQEKCKESSIINFSLQDTSYGPNKEQELFRLLEKELFNINAK